MMVRSSCVVVLLKRLPASTASDCCLCGYGRPSAVPPSPALRSRGRDNHSRVAISNGGDVTGKSTYSRVSQHMLTTPTPDRPHTQRTNPGNVSSTVSDGHVGNSCLVVKGSHMREFCLDRFLMRRRTRLRSFSGVASVFHIPPGAVTPPLARNVHEA